MIQSLRFNSLNCRFLEAYNQHVCETIIKVLNVLATSLVADYASGGSNTSSLAFRAGL